MEDFETLVGVNSTKLFHLILSTPSLRGTIVGYCAEHRLEEVFRADKRFEVVGKADDHDRKHKGDLYVRYRGRLFLVECKGLQTNSIKKQKDGTTKAKAQCDGSDASSKVKLRNGTYGKTVLLVVGGFDLLAVPLFLISGRWEFAYGLNVELPRTKSKKFAKKDAAMRLASLVSITVPVASPLTLDPAEALDRLIAKEKGKVEFPRSLPPRFVGDGPSGANVARD